MTSMAPSDIVTEVKVTSLEKETLEVLKGIHDLLHRIDGRLNGHEARLDRIQAEGDAVRDVPPESADISAKPSVEENVDEWITKFHRSSTIKILPYLKGVDISTNVVFPDINLGGRLTYPGSKTNVWCFPQDDCVNTGRLADDDHKLQLYLEHLKSSGGTLSIKDFVLADGGPDGSSKPVWMLLPKYGVHGIPWTTETRSWSDSRYKLLNSKPDDEWASTGYDLLRGTIEHAVKPFLAKADLVFTRISGESCHFRYVRTKHDLSRKWFAITIAPWRRRIVFQGLPQPMELRDTADCGDEIPFALKRSSETIAHFMWLGRRPRTLPYSMPRARGNSIRYTKTHVLHFRVPLFEIVSVKHSLDIQLPPREEVLTDTNDRQWVAGKLYGDRLGRSIRYGACSVSAHSGSFMESLLEYSFEDYKDERRLEQQWLVLSCPLYTSLLLGPAHFFDRMVEYDSVNVPTVLISLLRDIDFVMERVAKRWEEIGNYLKGLLVEDANFLEADLFVKLLFEDDHYSRSRKYFWILGCIGDFQNTIKDTSTHWSDFQMKHIDPFKELKKDEMSQPMHFVGEIDAYFATMNRVKLGLDEVREQTLLLRDGLFNASSVVESRASTRLGENVRLLTYVSIFYLPLAYCATLWAVPNILEHGTKIAFICTSLVVGVITYGVVFNLNNLADRGYRIVEPLRTKLLTSMGAQKETGVRPGVEGVSNEVGSLSSGYDMGSEAEEDSKVAVQGAEWWAEHARRFQTFGPDKDRTKPSEWLIVLFCLLQTCRWIGNLLPNIWRSLKHRSKSSRKTPRAEEPSNMVNEDREMSSQYSESRRSRVSEDAV